TLAYEDGIELRLSGRGLTPAQLEDGVAGSLEFTPRQVDLGVANLGEPAWGMATLSNPGGAPVALSEFTSASPHLAIFSEDCLAGLQVAGQMQPGETCDIYFELMPMVEGPQSATLAAGHG